MRQKYFKLESGMNSEANRERQNSKTTGNKLDTDTRQKLLGGVESLHGQKQQLTNTERLANETHDIMREANKELRDQRGIIVNVGQKNNDIRVDLERANSKVRTMRYREVIFKIILYLIILLLFIAIVTTLVVKIKNNSW